MGFIVGGILGLALLSGLLQFKKSTKAQRLFFLQVILWVIVLALSYVITDYQKQNNMPQNNQWLFNVSLLLEAAILHAAAYYFTKLKWLKYLVLSCLVIFLSAFVLQTIFGTFAEYFNKCDTLNCILMTLVFSPLLYEAFHNDERMHTNNGMIWIFVGLLIYFAGSIPYISVLEYLQSHNTIDNYLVMRLLTDLLANIRYLFLAIGFFMLYLSNSRVYINPHG
jgi:hypothetical protein